MEVNSNEIRQVYDSETAVEPVRNVPDEVMDTVKEEIAEAGGEMALPAEYDGSIGRTMFDAPSSEDGTVTVLMPRENLETLPMQTLVRIRSVADGRSYLGVTVKGPFAEPDGLRADATPLVAITIKGGILMPKYHGRAQIELLGEELPDGGVVPPRRRPLPNSPVFVLDNTETANVLRTAGNICIGLVEGKEEIEVKFPSGLKSVLPRHLGILGTTGGGKSTTVSGLIAQFKTAGIATILFDTEGEYTAINEPTADPGMLQALARRKKAPAGVENTHIYHLIGRETRNPVHPSLTKFRLDFSEISPNAFKEILGLSDAQEHRFFQAYDACKLLLRDLGVFPRSGNQNDEKITLELDEQERGYPHMILSYLIDIAGAFQHVVAKTDGDPTLFNPVFKNNLQKVMQRVKAVKSDSEVSWRALLARLWRIHRLKIFDNPTAESIDYGEILQPGRVSIIDLSDTDSPDVNNLVIAQILRGLQWQQDVNYQEAVKKNASPVPAIVLIEEAHEFLSSQRIKDMPILFQQVARIARRGRKRWLGLGFITQLPQHLPDEVLGLINNWVLHKISDAGVVHRLQRSIGGVDDSLWRRLPGLAPGQAIVVTANLARPIQTTVDPTPCRLLMVD